MPKCDFNKVALHCTSAWVFYCKFAAYFQNTFSSEPLWAAVSSGKATTIIKWKVFAYALRLCLMCVVCNRGET